MKLRRMQYFSHKFFRLIKLFKLSSSIHSSEYLVSRLLSGFIIFFLKIQGGDEDFLGFDSDPSIGTWRGWDKASSQKLTNLNEVIKNLTGSRDLEEVLNETVVATTSCLEVMSIFVAYSC